LVWIGSAHSLALGYCRLPTQPCACFDQLERWESLLSVLAAPLAV
jgi:hypothetical protein